MTRDSLTAHYEETFGANDGELYSPLAGFDLAAHNRRMEILSAIPLPDLSDATVMDYGVGSWGFGCVFEKLKSCANPIGVDISRQAIARSEQVSAEDPQLQGKAVKFLTSLGYSIDLPDESVDVIFCGECIEHVEDTDGFLTEFSRILKPGGTAIFTTPNASPYIYRQLGLKWCAGFEHVALMDYDEFKFWLSKYFEIERIYGFNQTISPQLDELATESMQLSWASASLDDPHNATSLIAHVRKPIDGRKWPAKRIQTVEIDEMQVFGPFEKLELMPGIHGLMIQPGAWIEVPVPADFTDCNLIFWSHDWSGICEVRCGDLVQRVDLYGHVGGCQRLRLGVSGANPVEIRPTLDKNDLSNSYQAIVYRATFSCDA